MNTEEYEKAKQECWAAVYDELIKDTNVPACTAYDVCCCAFKYAYRLGMEAAKKEQQTEPKFKVGDKVKDISSPHVGGIYKVDDIKKSSDGFIYHIQGLIGKSNVKESALELYTEPQEAAKKGLLTTNVDSSQPNVESLEETPAEPRFDIGAKVKCRGNIYKVAEIRRSYEQGYYYIVKSVLTGQGYQVFESDLVPYTEPQEDKPFDNIVKDGFQNERRLNIAAMILQGMLSNISVAKTNTLAKLAFKMADALIEESQKGENK